MTKSRQKIIVFATSFLDAPVRNHPDAGRAKKILESAAVEHGLDVEYRCDRNPVDPLELWELEDAVAVIADLERYEQGLLEVAGSGSGGTLRLIARYGIGCNSVDVAAAESNGVIVTNTPGASAPPTAEWAVATMMAVSGRCILQYQRAATGQKKSGPSRLDLYGGTLGIVGTGTIGRRVVDLLSGYGMSVLAHDPYPDTDWAKSRGVEYTDLDTLCGTADFISLHASGASRIIGEEQLQRMGSATVLVNCARGPMVDNRAAWIAVKQGNLYGYALDEIWEYPDLSLEGLNVLVSPHVGSDTDHGKLKMQTMSAEAVAQFLAGEKPTNIVTA